MFRIRPRIPSSRHARNMGRHDLKTTPNRTKKTRHRTNKTNTLTNVGRLNEKPNSHTSRNNPLPRNQKLVTLERNKTQKVKTPIRFPESRILSRMSCFVVAAILVGSLFCRRVVIVFLRLPRRVFGLRLWGWGL